MCVTIRIGQFYCTSVGELRKAIYPRKPVILEGYGLPIADHVCLCPIDLDATAATMEMIAQKYHDDPMFWILEKKIDQ